MRKASIIPAATFILAIACYPLAVLGQLPNSQPGQPTQVKPAQMCSLEGTVTSAKTGQPVKKALVEMHPTDKDQPYFSVITDASGHFVLKNLVAGRYQLGARANGYVLQRYGARSFRQRGTSLTLTSGQHKDGIDFRLTPWGVISGTVYDQDGDPVVGGVVRAMRSAYTERGRQWSYGGMARTDDRGEYRLYGIQPGRYLVVATYQRGGALVAADEAYLPTYFPSATDSAQATPLQVGAGEEVGAINLFFTKTRGVDVRGRVINLIAGQSPSIILVPHRTGAGAAGNYYNSNPNDQGEFEIRGVPPGEYLAYARFADEGPHYLGRSEVSVGSVDVNGVDIWLSSGIEMRGRVWIDTKTPPPFDFTRLSMGLRGVDETEGQAVAEIKADGTFVVPAVFDGTYRLVVRGFPEEFYLKSARLGDTDVLGKVLQVSHTQPPGTLDLMFSPKGGRIDGTVLNEQHPVEGAVVAFVPDDAHREHDELYSVTTTDSQGRFSLLGLPPGDFTLYAFDEVEDYAVKDPEFLGSYAGRGTAVHIVEKQQQTVQLNLIAVGE
ncbi:MAG: carboxypeptidase regulatory-like domain-containing protein [Terriglobia bacterium]